MASAAVSHKPKLSPHSRGIFASVETVRKQCWSISISSTHDEMLLFKWLGCMGLRRSKPVVPLPPEEKYLQQHELDALLDDKAPLEIDQPSEKVTSLASLNTYRLLCLDITKVFAK